MDRFRHDVYRSGSAKRARGKHGGPRTTTDRAQDAETRDLIRSVSKSIWRERYSKDFRFFCPFCSTPRRLGLHPKPGAPIHFAQVGLTAVLFTMAAWPFFGAKGLVSFVLFWVIFEVLYRAKVRASLRCPSCGFDPTLYLVDVERTKQGIREHWEKKRAERSAAPQQVTEPDESEDAGESEPIPAENDEEELTQPV